jgi:drug/metabolite transporter (DMT)-like permease
MDTNSFMPDILKAAVSILAGMIGRLMHHAREVQALRRQPFSWHLLWELPIACGMGLIANALCEYMGFSRTVSVGVVVSISYLGPSFVEIVALEAKKRWLS